MSHQEEPEAELEGQGPGTDSVSVKLESDCRDPLTCKGRFTTYQGISVKVTSVVFDVSSDPSVVNSKLGCILYSDGDRDATRAQARTFQKEGKVFAPCCGRWDVRKKGEGPWALVGFYAHSCLTYRDLEFSFAAPAVGTKRSRPEEEAGSLESTEGASEPSEDQRERAFAAYEEEAFPTAAIVSEPAGDDFRPGLICMAPIPGSALSMAALVQIREMLEKVPDECWHGLGGAKRKRCFLPYTYFEEGGRLAGPLLRTIEGAFAPYLAILAKLSPGEWVVRYGALYSEPGAKSQREYQNGKLHSDYPPEVMAALPAEERPWSLILALDMPFRFEYVPDFTEDRHQNICEMLTQAGHCLAFTEKLLHGGGKNETLVRIYRIFGYAVRNLAHVPKNRVYHDEARRDGKAGPSSRIAASAVSARGRSMKKPDRLTMTTV
jgi:hypothetical protein